MMIGAHESVKGTAPGTAPVLAIDLGATWTRAALVDSGGKVLSREAAPTLPDGEPGGLTAAIVAVAQAALSAPSAEGCARPAAVGVSAVGPLDAQAGTLYGPPNLGPGYRGLDLATPLHARFGVPVYLERDTNVAALGEHAFGAARHVDDFVYLTVSTGLGGAIFSGGRPLLGAHGVAGEFGHLPVMLGGPACGCGAAGHLEALSSGSGIARAGREAGIAPPPAGGPTSAPRPLTAADVAAAEQAGDERGAVIMGRAREAFAAAVVGIVNALDPSLIVVGGGVACGEGERLLAPAREALATYALSPTAATVAVVPAALGDDGGLIGCVPLIGGGGRPVVPNGEARLR
jgi:glucokinase